MPNHSRSWGSSPPPNVSARTGVTQPTPYEQSLINDNNRLARSYHDLKDDYEILQERFLENLDIIAALKREIADLTAPVPALRAEDV